MRTKRLMIGISAMLFSIACGSEPVEAPAKDSAEVGLDTVVEFGPDGKVLRVTEQVTKAEATSAGVAAITQGLTASETTCPSSALWVYDGTNSTGRRLCFVGVPGETINLADYCRVAFLQINPPRKRCVSRWDHAILSFWTGNRGGNFTATNRDGDHWGPPYECGAFTPQVLWSAGGYCSKNSIAINLRR